MANRQRQQQQGDARWIDNYVSVGNRDISFGTILLIGLGLLLSFGTSWLTGLFSTVGLSILLTSLAIYVAYRSRHLDVIEGIMQFLSFVIVFRLVLWFMITYVPQAVMENDMSRWQVIQGELAQQSPILEEVLADNLIDIPQATPDYNSFQNAPVPTAVPDAISPIPIPTAAPVPADPILALRHDLNAAVAANDRVAAKTAAEAILAVEPGNGQVQIILDEIARAEYALQKRLSNLPTRTSLTINPTDLSTVRNLLSGGTYKIVNSGAVLYKSACYEIATIRELTGFLAGQEYDVTRCLLDQFNVGNTGETFTVEAH